MSDTPQEINDGARAIAPETTEQVDEATEDVTAAFEKLAGALERFTPHLERLISQGIQLHPFEAAKEVPAATKDAIEDGGEALGALGNVGGHAVAAVPAAAEDVLETTQDAAHGTADAAKTTINSAKRRKLTRKRR